RCPSTELPGGRELEGKARKALRELFALDFQNLSGRISNNGKVSVDFVKRDIVVAFPVADDWQLELLQSGISRLQAPANKSERFCSLSQGQHIRAMTPYVSQITNIVYIDVLAVEGADHGKAGGPTVHLALLQLEWVLVKSSSKARGQSLPR